MTFNFEKIAPEYVDGFLEMVKKNQWSQIVRYVDSNGLCTEKIGCCGETNTLKRAIFEHFPETQANGKQSAQKSTTVVVVEH
jgi:hypothetical protein